MFVSLRTQPIKKGDHARRVGGHNARTDPRMSNGADESRTHLNQHLLKRASTVEEAINGMLDRHGVKPPKNAEAVAQEIVLSASPEYFRPGTDRNDPESFGKYDPDRLDAWKDKTTEWLKNRFKGALVDVQLHLDERTPHIHAVVVPITNKTQKKRRTKQEIEEGKEPEEIVKKKWNRSAFFSRSKLYDMQESYGEALAELGLNRGIPKKITKQKYQDLNSFRKSEVKKSEETKKPKKAKNNSLTMSI